MNEPVTVKAVSDPCLDRIVVYVRPKVHPDGQPVRPKIGRLVFEEVKLDGHWTPPTMELGQDEAQALADSLWAAGIQPRGGKGSAGQLAATERHLEDMRQLAFGALKKLKPEQAAGHH